jgi:hypothetical protein
VRLNRSEEFKRKTVEVAAARGIEVRFSDIELVSYHEACKRKFQAQAQAHDILFIEFLPLSELIDSDFCGKMKTAFIAEGRQISLVPGAGIEPARCLQRGILSPVRLPIPPSRQRDPHYGRFGRFQQLFWPCA